MNSISKLLFGLGIAASISGTSVAADSGITNIDIEGGFGLKLGAKIAYEAIDSALPKESDWQVHKSYVLKDKPENGFIAEANRKNGGASESMSTIGG